MDVPCSLSIRSTTNFDQSDCTSVVLFYQIPSTKFLTGITPRVILELTYKEQTTPFNKTNSFVYTTQFQFSGTSCSIFLFSRSRDWSISSRVQQQYSIWLRMPMCAATNAAFILQIIFLDPYDSSRSGKCITAWRYQMSLLSFFQSSVVGSFALLHRKATTTWM